MVLRAQPAVEVISSLVGLLKRVARLYQIPGFKDEDALELADWILDRYPTELSETVIRALKNPPLVTNWKKDQVTNWRLTPDTIGEWMSIEAEKSNDELNNGRHLVGPITEEELKPIPEETKKLMESTVQAFKIGAIKEPWKKPFKPWQYFNIGEECPACHGKGSFDHELTKEWIQCRYCEGKGAIGIVEIKAETEGEARTEYGKRFGVENGLETKEK